MEVSLERQVVIGSTVTMHMKIMLKDKSIAQNTKDDGQPISAMVGEGAFSENFEKHLLGLKVGEKTAFMVMAADGFGEINAANIQTLPRQQFPQDADLDLGVIFMFAQSNGLEIPGIVRDISAEQVTVDFNHPLSGHDLIFEVEVLDIEISSRH